MTALVKLAAAAENAIRACRGATSPVHGSGEVAEVARLVLQLPQELTREWSKHLSTGELDVIGVFSHKAPKTSWTGKLDQKTYQPELCDLLLVFDIEDGGSRTKRALMIQAKVADPKMELGGFIIAKDGEDVQRYLYVHLPPFTLTGLNPIPGSFDIKPSTDGTCLGSRYAGIKVGSSAPNSGWWLEKTQPTAPANPKAMSDYAGKYDAEIPLGQALYEMLTGSLGAELTPSSEWERLVQHLLDVATKRDHLGKSPPDVKASAAGNKLSHLSKSSIALYDARHFFEHKACTGYEFLDFVNSAPPDRGGTPDLSEEMHPGFGIVYVRLISPVWHDD
ncbi:hypothetical protein [Stenotrophomonas sp. AR029]|uniref:hypothetical protein n=1 Tax=Stenotrophomonas sp. AR029 TaxID=3398601 RepID=UPI0039C5F497